MYVYTLKQLIDHLNQKKEVYHTNRFTVPAYITRYHRNLDIEINDDIYMFGAFNKNNGEIIPKWAFQYDPKKYPVPLVVVIYCENGGTMNYGRSIAYKLNDPCDIIQNLGMYKQITHRIEIAKCPINGVPTKYPMNNFSYMLHTYKKRKEFIYPDYTNMILYSSDDLCSRNTKDSIAIRGERFYFITVPTKEQFKTCLQYHGTVITGKNRDEAKSGERYDEFYIGKGYSEYIVMMKK